jgi:hypothetical protein
VKGLAVQVIVTVHKADLVVQEEVLEAEVKMAKLATEVHTEAVVVITDQDLD